MQIQSPYRIVRRPEARQQMGEGDTAFNEKVKNGLLPPSIKLGARAVGWVDYELDAVMAAKIAGKSDDFIRALVSYLIEQRKKILSTVHIPHNVDEPPVNLEFAVTTNKNVNF